jgi:hypothetical protein
MVNIRKWFFKVFLNAALFCYEHPDVAKVLEGLKTKE